MQISLRLFEKHLLRELGQVGGISRTVRCGDSAMDIGGHRFFTKVRAVEELWAAFGENSRTPIDLPGALSRLGPHIQQRYSAPVCDERTHLALLKCAALLHDVAPAGPIAGEQHRRVQPLCHDFELERQVVAGMSP